MRTILLAVPLGLMVLTIARAGDAVVDKSIRQAFARCQVLEDAHERVHCYDKLATMLAPPRFQGRLTVQTDLFAITEPTILRYESDGPIFVMYLKDAAGGTVQNLHIGGGGVATFLIETPGTYSLQVSGSESWRIWLDPA